MPAKKGSQKKSKKPVPSKKGAKSKGVNEPKKKPTEMVAHHGTKPGLPEKARAPVVKKLSAAQKEKKKEELRNEFIDALAKISDDEGPATPSGAGGESEAEDQPREDHEDEVTRTEAAMAEVLAENERLQKKAGDRARKPKLEKPGDFDGGKGKYRAWVRTINVWKNVHEDVDDRVLGAMLLQALSGKALDAVTGSLGDAELSSFEALMNILEEFGADDVIEALDAEAEFQRFSRNGQDLNEFITMYDALKKKAMRHGLRESEITAGSNLLKKADVSAGVRANIIAQITATGASMSYAEVKRQLKANATANELVAESDSLKKSEKKALVAKGFAEGKAKGKGAQMQRVKSEGGGKGPQWSGDGQKKVCWYHQQGKCLKGDKCPWQHPQAQVQALKGKKGKDGKNGKGKGKGKGLEWREGDWECPNASCKDHQFAANAKCRKCGTAKPS